PTFKKILDFAQRTSDNGLYVAGSRLRLYPGGEGSTDVVAHQDLTLTLTRNGATGETEVYFNNVCKATYTGGLRDVAVPLTNVLTFFEDDGTSECVAGSVDYIATFNGVLTPEDVGLIGATSLGVSANQPIVGIPEGQTAHNTGSWTSNGIEVV